MGALSEKTVLLVTHQVELLQAFDSVLVSIDAKPSQLTYCEKTGTISLAG
uniref:Uncharacterized protein n=1 Tax=Arundo donax TaxID=35708 RepID=A0A0A8YQI8_ARUDO